ncbi:MAG: 30S ribosomal protein S5 [Candidatus Portnoybacteria bacterium CG06_land_8_20_14_3_00_39_12]|uniref:Small ribosomal subunit protein uS5 n=2 Tax=Candidatus Portnoyibacteriota TaxID=1817913 RepID=A0A2M7UIZ9_9BACT|nr:MAG: 30S ribosomal protein S5 [Parcubacteria group bacterium CG1_02_40_25]PIU75322.1 MAG: 30S ribosomal protein S5 [Candidatus Portnoybacteria bacterium CG06_land_8_20_14_3_00_39_12]PIZ71189.1 MAG: 30S ribosomal protein S5 [Candidatus Portnoybacteria bacterium CG_4_10_14_0_2_um_filter_39_11]
MSQDRNYNKKQNEKDKEYDSRVLDIARITRVVAGGRRFRFRAVVVMGDGKGKIGIGLAKGADVALAVEKATHQAKKHLEVIKIKNGTISHLVAAKYSAAKIILMPAKHGRGIVAGGAVRAVCELAGIKDVVAKIISRSTNKLNNARATLVALRKLKA